MATQITGAHAARRARTAARPVLAAPPYWLWSLALALLLAGAALWPLPARLHTHTVDTGDALHLAWALRWAQLGMLGEAPAFYAPAGFPYPQTLLLNPPLYSFALFGLPLAALGWGPAAVYNGLVLLSFALAGWALMLLGRRLSGSAAGGLAAGILYAFSDVRLAHLMQLNLLSGFWTALLLALALRAWREPPRTRRGLLGLGLAAGLLAAGQALGDVYNAIFMAAALSLLGLCWAAWLPSDGLLRPARSRALLALAAGGLFALALAAPVLLPTLRAWGELGVARPWADHERYAAGWDHYLLPSHPRQLYDPAVLAGDAPADPTEQRLWPGLATLSLAGLGLLAPGPRRERAFLLALAGLALALSLGPALPGYRWLFDHAPLLSAARVPARWALLLQLPLAGLAAVGVRALVGTPAARMPGYEDARRWRAKGATALWPPALHARLRLTSLLRALVAFVLLGLCVADVRPTHVPTTREVAGEPTPEVYGAIAGLPAGALLEWPLENASPTLAHRYQWQTLAHGRPLVNAATSAAPPRYAALHAALRSFPASGATRLLRDIGVRYVVVNRWEIGAWAELAPRLEAAPGLRLLGAYEGGRHLLYEVLAEQPATPAPLAVLGEAGGHPQLTLQLAAPLWLAPPAELYRGEREAPVQLRRADGSAVSLRLRLPPLLLPGAHRWVLPAAAEGAVALSIGAVSLPLALPPALVGPVDGPALAATAPPARLAPGDTLPCLAAGRLPAGDGLVLAAALVDAGWNVVAKRDHFIAAAAGPLPCDLDLPASLAPGDYFLALGIYDPAAGAFVPVTGADGVRSPGLWRVPASIAVVR